jgi:hypothetical protein
VLEPLLDGYSPAFVTHTFLCSAFLSVSLSHPFVVTEPPLRAFRREPSARLRLVRSHPAPSSLVLCLPLRQFVSVHYLLSQPLLTFVTVRFRPAFASSITGQPSPAPSQGSLRQLHLHRSTAFASFIAGQPSPASSPSQDRLRQFHCRASSTKLLAEQPLRSSMQSSQLKCVVPILRALFSPLHPGRKYSKGRS